MVSCVLYVGFKLLSNAMKIIQKILLKNTTEILRTNVNYSFFFDEKGFLDALFVLLRMEEEYQKKQSYRKRI